MTSSRCSPECIVRKLAKYASEHDGGYDPNLLEGGNATCGRQVLIIPSGPGRMKNVKDLKEVELTLRYRDNNDLRMTIAQLGSLIACAAEFASPPVDNEEGRVVGVGMVKVWWKLMRETLLTCDQTF